MELEWLANRSTSALHAADAILSQQPIASPPLAEALAQPASELRSRLAATGLAAEMFFRHAVPLSLIVSDDRELADAVLRKTLGADAAGQHAAELALGLSAVQRAAVDAQPQLLDELEARGKPLLEQWEARGPGLLAAIGRTTEPDLLSERAAVALVYPIGGGGGASHVLYNSVRIEAVLTNPTPELPEIVRLAWLLSLLQFDLPRYAERLPIGRAAEIASLAMIPPALDAATYVELTHLDAAKLIRPALDTWCPPCGDDIATAQLAETLATWWRTYTDGRPPWPVALDALGLMLTT